MKTLLIHAWSLRKYNNDYYLPYTHWIYLNEIVKYYDKIILLSPVKKYKAEEDISYINLKDFTNISVYELPPSNGYIGAIKYFFKYLKAYKDIKNVDVYYARYPTPFGWLQKKYGKGAKRIIHYVGDPIDAAENNPNFSFLKKQILIKGFQFENILYNWACRGATVYTNGYHIAEKLAKKDIHANVLISSTLTDGDFVYQERKVKYDENRFVYLGYLRKAKGVETIIRSFGKFQKNNPDASLTIIGDGEFKTELLEICKTERIANVSFLGHIDNRGELNDILRNHNVFLFASLSEGSPRVILEAMANGLAVISTPVGSLPKVFEDMKDIVFADFNNPEDFSLKMNILSSNEDLYNAIREKGRLKAKSFTLSKFINTIFNEG